MRQLPAEYRWHKLDTEPYRGKQDDIHFIDEKLGFYVNGKGKAFRTEDGGGRWRQVFERPGTYFRAIGMLTASHGFAGNIGTDCFPGVTDTQPLYETRDRGLTWRPVAGLPGPPVKGICAIDVQRVAFVDAGVLDQRILVHGAGRVGGPAFLPRSLDGGRSWRTIDMSPWAAMIMDVRFFDEMNGLVFAASDANVERAHAPSFAPRTAARPGGRSTSPRARSRSPGRRRSRPATSATRPSRATAAIRPRRNSASPRPPTAAGPGPNCRWSTTAARASSASASPRPRSGGLAPPRAGSRPATAGAVGPRSSSARR